MYYQKWEMSILNPTRTNRNQSEREDLPEYVLLWRGDREFPVRAVIGIDARVHFHLDLAGALALTNLLVYRLCK